MNITSCLAVLLITTSAYAHVYPSGGATSETIAPGSNITIKWDKVLNAPALTVGLWDGARETFTTIASNVSSNQQSLDWVVPHNIAQGQYYRFVVRNSYDTTRAILSESFITIGRQAPIISTVDNEVDPTGITVTLSPQPANEHVAVSWNGYSAYRVEIRDLTGKAIVTKEPHSDVRKLDLPLHNLSAGMYRVVVMTELGYVGGAALVVVR